MIFDAHFHYAQCLKQGLTVPTVEEAAAYGGWSGLSCAHSIEEWEVQEEAVLGETAAIVGGPAAGGDGHVASGGASADLGADSGQGDSRIKLAFGLHPQACIDFSDQDILKNAKFLEWLLKAGKLYAIGEAGFDYFTKEFLAESAKQEKMWQIQLEFAVKYQTPLVVHCRKANHKLFEYGGELKKVPKVLFHSFMGSPVEAEGLLRRGINAYFSFGKQIFNNNKKVIACVKELPEERLLCETDAPFQFLKGEKWTEPKDIFKIKAGFEELRHTKG